MEDPDEHAVAVANFAFELGVLKRVRRAGWWHLGVRDPESVAEHSLRVAQLASLIAAIEGAEPGRAALLAVWHDSQETRTGDIPHTAKPYLDRRSPELITTHQTASLPDTARKTVQEAVAEYEAQQTPESHCAKDADKLECLIQAIEYQDAGYARIQGWIDSSRSGLRTDTDAASPTRPSAHPLSRGGGAEIASRILNAPPEGEATERRSEAPTAARLRWVAAERDFVQADDPTSEPAGLQVMDSWLVENGRVRALSAHIRRFSSACARITALPPECSAEFVRAAVQRIPRTGRWFPRVELVGSDAPELQLWIRPAPARGDAVRLWISAEPDRRVHPSVKGADLDHLAGLRQEAADAGADEALILATDGRIREGASTSILWWRRDVLCAPPETPEILPGVTRTVLLRLAAEHGIRVEFEEPTPPELAGREVWAVNALHGIRPVSRWVGALIDAGPAHRARRWNAQLDRLAKPVLTEPMADDVSLGR